MRIVPKPRAPRGEPPPPPGVWCVLDRGPAGARTWWVQPVDLEAQHWAATHPGDIVQGCWLAPDNQMAPMYRERI